MEDDEVSGVPQNMPLQQVPQGIYQQPRVIKKRRLSKKAKGTREKKILYNIQVKLGILPSNTPLKKLTEDEHIEFTQRLVNIKNMNITRNTGSGLGATVFSNPVLQLPPQYPPQPNNMPIGISAPVSSGYSMGSSGQIIPIPIMPSGQELLGSARELLKIMDRTDRGIQKPLDTPQGQRPMEGAANRPGEQTVDAREEERGNGIQWLKQGQQSRRGVPYFPDEKYIGPSPMRSKYELMQTAQYKREATQSAAGGGGGASPLQRSSSDRRMRPQGDPNKYAIIINWKNQINEIKTKMDGGVLGEEVGKRNIEELQMKIDTKSQNIRNTYMPGGGRREFERELSPDESRRSLTPPARRPQHPQAGNVLNNDQPFR
jgi:hypothetical protein